MNLFASLYVDREPLHWEQMPAAVVIWLQNAGAVAAFGVFLVLLAGFVQRDSRNRSFFNLPGNLQLGFAFAGYFCLATAISYQLPAVVLDCQSAESEGAAVFLPRPTTVCRSRSAIGFWPRVGRVALFIALAPLAIDLFTRISGRRIWAIARLSWKEAVRGRVVWVFGAMVLVFLFADWFVPYKAGEPISQLRACRLLVDGAAVSFDRRPSGVV